MTLYNTKYCAGFFSFWKNLKKKKAFLFTSGILSTLVNQNCFDIEWVKIFYLIIFL